MILNIPDLFLVKTYQSSSPAYLHQLQNNYRNVKICLHKFIIRCGEPNTLQRTTLDMVLTVKEADTAAFEAVLD